MIDLIFAVGPFLLIALVLLLMKMGVIKPMKHDNILRDENGYPLPDSPQDKQ